MKIKMEMGWRGNWPADSGRDRLNFYAEQLERSGEQAVKAGELSAESAENIRKLAAASKSSPLVEASLG